MTINELTREIHDNAVAHGWWDEPRSFAEIMALCVSELGEALEEDRAGRPAVWFKCLPTDVFAGCENMTHCESANSKLGCVKMDTKCPYRDDKPEGIAVEMADCIIRILDWAGQAGVDMEAIILAKHEYNKGRPYKHGKKY